MNKNFLKISLIVVLSIISITIFLNEKKISYIIYDEEFNNLNVEINENTELNYYDYYYLEDLISLEEGILKNSKINTTTLGEHSTYFYYTINSQAYKGIINYSVVDKEAPKILNSGSYSVKIGNTINFEEKIFVVDNYDTTVNCKTESPYDINEIGIYPIKFKCTDSNYNTSYAEFNLYVKEEITYSTYEPSKIFFKDVIEKHKTENTKIGIDVSHWQGDINWEAVKDAGCEFAIIRIGYAPDEDGNLFIDSKYKENLKNAKAAGIDVGIYYFSYARTVDDAVDHAEQIIDMLDGEKLDYPIVFDWENWTKFKTYGLNTKILNNMAIEFSNLVTKHGYTSMNYSSAYYLKNLWEVDMKTWLAHYTESSWYEGEYEMWQLTDTGIIDGIEGYVDINVHYIKK